MSKRCVVADKAPDVLAAGARRMRDRKFISVVPAVVSGGGGESRPPGLCRRFRRLESGLAGIVGGTTFVIGTEIECLRAR